jgi:hypothetical protein
MSGVNLDYTIDGGQSGSRQYPGTGPQTHTFTGVPKINTAGVRNGTPVGNVCGYTVALTAYNAYGSAAGATVKIWNVPGMSVRNAYPAEEISTQEQLAAMVKGNAGKKYVLVNNITLSGAWTPIGTGTGANAFQGIFYGNGHTITVGSGFTFSNTANTGIFGYTDGNAVIRDLAVVYNADVTTGGSATRIGGIVGYVGGSTRISNCVVSGTSGATLSKAGTSEDIYLGGMAGHMDPGAVIANGSSGLNVRLENSTGKAWAGGAAGYIAEGGDGSVTNIDGVSVSGNVSLVKTDNSRLYIGGVVGASVNQGWIKNVSFSGTVSASTTASVATANSIGGIVGYAMRTSFEGCVFAGTIRTPVDGHSFLASGGTYNETRIGGIAGYYTTGGKSPTMRDSISSGMFSIAHDGAGTLSLGGVVGLVNAKKTDTGDLGGDEPKDGNGKPENMITIENCWYELGNIILERDSLGSGRYDQIGGFVGKLDPGIIRNCKSLAGLIKVTGNADAYAGSLWAGGFVSEIRQFSTVQNCYSASPVEAYNYYATSRLGSDYVGRGMSVGGFVAFMQDKGTIEKCYASGAVTAYAVADRLAVGGFAGKAGLFDADTNDKADNTIKYCYAAGNVSASSGRTVANSPEFGVGGLVGITGGTVISNCYARGEVFAEANSGDIPVYAGGITGHLSNATSHSGTYDGKIEKSFATGSVTAHSAVSSAVYAGGIVGYVASGTVEKNAALGSLVNAQSNSASRNAGRAYGYSYTPVPHSANYAISSMTLEEDNYDIYTPAFATPVDDATGQDGADALASVFRNQTIWKNALSFSTPDWDFSTIYMGRPKLAGLGGQ